MKYYLQFSISAHIELTKDQFNFLFDSFQNSPEYKYETELGGFMYSKRNTFNSGITEIPFDIYELGIVLRTLSGYFIEAEKETREKLYSDLDFILRNLIAKKIEINKQDLPYITGKLNNL